MNHIKRTAKRITYKLLVDTSAGVAGDIFEAWRDESGWHTRNATKNDAIYYYCFLSHLRNENYTQFIYQFYDDNGIIKCLEY